MKGEKWYRSYVCLCDLLPLQNAQLQMVILSQNKATQQKNQAITSHLRCRFYKSSQKLTSRKEDKAP